MMVISGSHVRIFYFITTNIFVNLILMWGTNKIVIVDHVDVV